METITLKDRPDLQKIVRMIDPKCRKTKAFVHRTKCVALSGTYWDGGSRSSYYLVNLATNEVKPAGQNAPVQFGGPRVDPVQKIEAGFAVVELGTFCGKPATPAIYLSIEG